MIHQMSMHSQAASKQKGLDKEEGKDKLVSDYLSSLFLSRWATALEFYENWLRAQTGGRSVLVSVHLRQMDELRRRLLQLAFLHGCFPERVNIAVQLKRFSFLGADLQSVVADFAAMGIAEEHASSLNELSALLCLLEGQSEPD